MLWAISYSQQLDPLHGRVPGSQVISTFFAALPVVVLFYLLVPRRWLAPWAGAAASVAALLIAVVVYGMPLLPATMAFAYGAGFGLLPVGWTIFNAMLLYNITVQTGKFVRQGGEPLRQDADGQPGRWRDAGDRLAHVAGTGVWRLRHSGRNGRRASRSNDPAGLALVGIIRSTSPNPAL